MSVGDRVYAYIKYHGYVGFGEVTSEAVMTKDYRVQGTETPLLEAGLTAPNAADDSEDKVYSEWVVGVRWIKTVSKSEAKTFAGIFANQNVVCKLRDPTTLEFVHETFGK